MMSVRAQWRLWSVLGGLTVLAGLALAQFVVPSKQSREAAVGSLSGLEPVSQRTFSDHGEFEEKRKPGSSDWLAQHREPGQTFSQFVRSGANKPGGARSTLYILPVGEFAEGRAPELKSLQEYAMICFHPLKVLVHESGHMFGIRHCIHYECLMNGSNHLGETDASPVHLCPVCLRKLHHALKFDPVVRYRKLRDFYRAKGLKEEAEWVKGRLGRIDEL
jgi:hypothetical protein